MSSRIPRPAEQRVRSGNSLSPPSAARPRSASPTLRSPSPQGRPRAATRVSSPLASPDANHVRPQSKSYFRSKDSRAPSPGPKLVAPTKTSPIARRPVPAYSTNGDSNIPIPRSATRKASMPNMAAKLSSMPIQSLSKGVSKPLPSIPTPSPLAPTKTIGRKRGASFSLKPKVKAKPPKPPETTSKSAFLTRAVAPAKSLAVNSRVAQGMSMNVPPHIRLRLRLIHQLSVVLGIPPNKVSSVLDVPGLLARVDGVFEKAQRVFPREREGSVVSIPGIEASSGENKEEEWWMYPPNWSEKEDMPVGRPRRGSTISQMEGKGVLTKLRRLGRKEDPRKEEEDPRKEVDVGRPASQLQADECDQGIGEEDTEQIEDSSNPFAWMGESMLAWLSLGSAFGVAVTDLPAEAWCRTRFGGHIHQLPLVLYLTIEHIWKNGGITTAGIFRLSGNTARVDHLCEVFAKAPLYGDQYPLQPTESPHNMASILKRWLRDLPEPIVDDALGPALYTFCAEPDLMDLSVPSPARITAARVLLQLLPPPCFSIMTYLLAFLSQLNVTVENKLGLDAIGIIFGPALLASRANGVPGLGPRSRGCKNPDMVSIEVAKSQKTLAWLVTHWPKIAEGIMDCAIPDPLAKAASTAAKAKEGEFDRRLLSPIDLRRTDTTDAYGGLSKDGEVDGTGRLNLDFSFEREGRGNKGMTRSESHGSLLSRAFSSMSISSLYSSPDGDKSEKQEKAAQVRGLKKSQSFSNLSGKLKRTLTGSSAKVSKRMSPVVSLTSVTSELEDFRGSTPFPVPRPLKASISVSSLHTRAPSEQITSVLGSLQDLLITKDRQIERDARELAMLRHTLLEMDEKLQRPSCICFRTSTPSSKSCPPSPGSPDLLLMPRTPPTPEITITSSESTQEINDSVVLDLQSQLSTAMSALESVRLKNRSQEEKITHLESILERAEKWHAEKVKRKDEELALEVARGQGWKLERDVAKRRLEKVKEDLFGVS